MAKNKKPTKKRKSAQEMLRRTYNIKMKNLLIEMKFICHPIDKFFDELRNEEMLFIGDTAVLHDDYLGRYIGISSSCKGFCDTMKLLYEEKNLDVSEIEPMQKIFSVVDSQESFTEKELNEAEISWKKVRNVIAMSTFGEMTAITKKFQQLERNQNGINQ